MNSKTKKLVITNLPYLFIALMATKLGLAWRLAEGADFAGKATHFMDGLSLAFETLMPSFHSLDLFVGLAVGAGIRMAVYVRGKNAKKYRKNMEYGSARWGTSEDIRPYVDPVFQNNVILTQTERLAALLLLVGLGLLQTLDFNIERVHVRIGAGFDFRLDLRCPALDIVNAGRAVVVKGFLNGFEFHGSYLFHQ